MNVGNKLGTTQTQDYVLMGFLALAGYIFYNFVQGVKTTAKVVTAGAQAVGHAYTFTVDAVASDLYNLFGPDDAQALSNMSFLMVNFPDGSRHAISRDRISESGQFLWTGYPANTEAAITLTLVKDKSGAWYATLDQNNTLLSGATSGDW